jgi:hypothetical protein
MPETRLRHDEVDRGFRCSPWGVIDLPFALLFVLLSGEVNLDTPRGMLPARREVSSAVARQISLLATIRRIRGIFAP